MLSSSAFKSAIKSVNSNLDDVIADIKTQTKDMDPKIRKEFVNKMRDEIISKLDIQNLV